MTVTTRIAVAVFVVGWLALSIPVCGDDFLRGDCLEDGQVTFVDSLFLAVYLFLEGPSPNYYDAADTNDDGFVDIADVVYLQSYLTGALPSPPPPFFGCGPDSTTDGLSCDYYYGCQ